MQIIFNGIGNEALIAFAMAFVVVYLPLQVFSIRPCWRAAK